ncbi:hypothetical protein T484DRAFT_1956903, partial [Baffinella frigidus]
MMPCVRRHTEMPYCDLDDSLPPRPPRSALRRDRTLKTIRQNSFPKCPKEPSPEPEPAATCGVEPGDERPSTSAEATRMTLSEAPYARWRALPRGPPFSRARAKDSHLSLRTSPHSALKMWKSSSSLDCGDHLAVAPKKAWSIEFHPRLLQATISGAAPKASNSTPREVEFRQTIYPHSATALKLWKSSPSLYCGTHPAASPKQAPLSFNPRHRRATVHGAEARVHGASSPDAAAHPRPYGGPPRTTADAAPLTHRRLRPRENIKTPTSDHEQRLQGVWDDLRARVDGPSARLTIHAAAPSDSAAAPGDAAAAAALWRAQFTVRCRFMANSGI